MPSVRSLEAVPTDAHQALNDAMAEFRDAGFLSGADACEHYLACLATLALWEFQQRHLTGDFTPAVDGTAGTA